MVRGLEHSHPKPLEVVGAAEDQNEDMIYSKQEF